MWRRNKVLPDRPTQPLILPEYGRNVQNMVDFCLEIDDRKERQQCAEAIIRVMSNISTKVKESEEGLQVLWDHLYIMSDFKLDIDFPYEVTTKEAYLHREAPVLTEHKQKRPAYRHYGRNVDRMIHIVKQLPEGEERDALACLTAMQMKRNYVAWNKLSVDNIKIFKDLYELSEGEIYLDEMSCQLPDIESQPVANVAPSTKSKATQPKRRISINRKRYKK